MKTAGKRRKLRRQLWSLHPRRPLLLMHPLARSSSLSLMTNLVASG